MNPCPCCRTPGQAGAADQFDCPACHHRWRTTAPDPSYYAASAGRNPAGPELARKQAERLTALAPWLVEGARVLEIGCAEGSLGALAKAHAPLCYVGIELSGDAEIARGRLDAVHRTPAASLAEGGFDLLLAFHVLEHIADLAGELAAWRRLLKTGGQLVVEVPNGAGHPLLDNDRHPEHLHQFTAASLAVALQAAGFAIDSLTTGHHESAVYPDSLRVLARPARSPAEKRQALLARFRRKLPGPFVVYGIGGDFHNYVAPLLADLPVSALCDSDSARHGRQIGALCVGTYDPRALAGQPVLLASTRHAAAITDHLQGLGVAPAAIVTLAEIYG